LLFFFKIKVKIKFRRNIVLCDNNEEILSLKNWKEIPNGMTITAKVCELKLRLNIAIQAIIEKIDSEDGMTITAKVWELKLRLNIAFAPTCPNQRFVKAPTCPNQRFEKTDSEDVTRYSITLFRDE
jgi:hypothetical protein